MTADPHETDIARYIWRLKYSGAGDTAPEQTWRRVAAAAAAVEKDPEQWRDRFEALLRGFHFLPGGRILAGAGTGLQVTLFNCFVMGLIPDELDGIFNSLREGALTMQAGGGVGYDFSTLRPRGSAARATGNVASGPVSFMHIWNAACATLLSTGARRGAMIATLRCDHPDIEEFIAAKREPGALTHFNLSVQVSDAFMAAVAADAQWPLVFPRSPDMEGKSGETVLRDWPGASGPVPCMVYRRVSALELWRALMHANYDNGEPGVLFVDRINAMNNLAWRERISCTNPCGEIPLPPYGACNLGSLNLTAFVQSPFTANAGVDLPALARAAALATRFLDNVIDIGAFPLPQQREVELGSRRVGLGLTGLADALIMLGLDYGTAAGRELAAQVMQTVCHAAYRSSIALAREKGSFPFFEREPYLRSAFIADLPSDIRAGIWEAGIRNSHLTAIAPAGTISLLAGNVSSGIEPVFAFEQTRRVLAPDGGCTEFRLEDYALRRWRETGGAADALPAAFVSAQELAPLAHLAMQAALQPFVDNAISKTVNVPAGCSFEDFVDIYLRAYSLGLKGCTTFRSGGRRQALLAPAA